MAADPSVGAVRPRTGRTGDASAASSVGERRLHRGGRFRPRLLSLPALALLCAVGVATLYPVFYTVVTSLKTRVDFASDPLGLPPAPTLANFIAAFDRLDLGRLLFNSAVTTLGGVVLTIFASFLAAYAVAYLRFPGRLLAFSLIVAALAIPNQAIMYPLFMVVQSLGLVGSYPGLILTYGAFGVSLGTYFLASYFKSLPYEIIEAAIVDGASHIQILRYIIVPLSAPVIASLAIFNFVWMWNDLLLPLLVIGGKENKTLMVGVTLFRGQYDISVPLYSAGLIIAMVPTVAIYLIFQRHLVKAATAGAVK